MPENLLAARLLMAFTLGYHIILASLGVGLPVLLLAAEWRYLKSGDEGWKSLTRRWSKAFAVLFGVGAVSGTVLSFEIGILWPGFLETYGAVVGLPFTLEAFAFFVEAIFVGIYLYGWDRMRPRAHWCTGLPIALGGLASAWFVVTANAWMNAPQGFTLAAGKVVDVDPVAAMLNPATGAQTTHMILAAYLVTGFLVASYYALRRLRGDDSRHSRRAMALGLGLAVLCTPAQLYVGHWSAQVVARTQPAKLAAMEGQFRTEARAPLRIGGVPDEEARTTRYAIEVSGGLSWLAYGDADAVVRGLDDFPSADAPPVRFVHFAFQLMVAAGGFFLVVCVWVTAVLLLQRRLPAGRPFLACVVACGPLSVVALESGWVVTELGRQPWVIQGILRTRDAVTEAPGIAWMLWLSVGVYAILSTGMAVVLAGLARKPLRGA